LHLRKVLLVYSLQYLLYLQVCSGFLFQLQRSPQVLEFLAFEMDYLKGCMDRPKIIMSLAVPLFFFMLLIAAWKRNWKWLLGVIIGAAVLKFIWSIAFSGEAGMSILKPALLGLIVCIGGLSYFFKKHKRAGKKQKISK
jgi:hypothetical protein